MQTRFSIARCCCGDVVSECDPDNYTDDFSGSLDEYWRPPFGSTWNGSWTVSGGLLRGTTEKLGVLNQHVARIERCHDIEPPVDNNSKTITWQFKCVKTGGEDIGSFGENTALRFQLLFNSGLLTINHNCNFLNSGPPPTNRPWSTELIGHASFSDSYGIGSPVYWSEGDTFRYEFTPNNSDGTSWNVDLYLNDVLETSFSDIRYTDSGGELSLLNFRLDSIINDNTQGEVQVDDVIVAVEDV